MLALDEPGDDDNVFEIDGFKVVVNKDLLKDLVSINVDAGSNGFMVTASGLAQSSCPSAEGGCSC